MTLGPGQGGDDHRTDAVSNGIAGQNQDRTFAPRCRCKPDFTSLHPPVRPVLGRAPISDVRQRLLAQVERVLGPSDRIVLAGQANEVAMKGLAQQFGPIDAEPLGQICASAASASSTRKLNIVIHEGNHV